MWFKHEKTVESVKTEKRVTRSLNEIKQIVNKEIKSFDAQEDQAKEAADREKHRHLELTAKIVVKVLGTICDNPKFYVNGWFSINQNPDFAVTKRSWEIQARLGELLDYISENDVKELMLASMYTKNPYHLSGIWFYFRDADNSSNPVLHIPCAQFSN